MNEGTWQLDRLKTEQISTVVGANLLLSRPLLFKGNRRPAVSLSQSKREQVVSTSLHRQALREITMA